LRSYTSQRAPSSSDPQGTGPTRVHLLEPLLSMTVLWFKGQDNAFTPYPHIMVDEPVKSFSTYCPNEGCDDYEVPVIKNIDELYTAEVLRERSPFEQVFAAVCNTCGIHWHICGETGAHEHSSVSLCEGCNKLSPSPLVGRCDSCKKELGSCCITPESGVLQYCGRCAKDVRMRNSYTDAAREKREEWESLEKFNQD